MALFGTIGPRADTGRREIGGGPTTTSWRSPSYYILWWSEDVVGGSGVMWWADSKNWFLRENLLPAFSLTRARARSPD
jgi:hypothetical protein